MRSKYSCASPKYSILVMHLGFQNMVKNQPANARDTRDLGLILGSRISPREGNGIPRHDLTFLKVKLYIYYSIYFLGVKCIFSNPAAVFIRSIIFAAVVHSIQICSRLL